MTYCAECGVELTEGEHVCQKCGNFVFTRENITQKIIGRKERMILIFGNIIILLGIFMLIYISIFVPSNYRVPVLYGFVVIIVLLGLFFVIKRRRILDWNKNNILNTYFAPIHGLSLSDEKVHCFSCGTDNLGSRQICRKCKEILLTEEILYERMTYNARKTFSVLGVVSIICGTFFAILYIQYDLNLITFFWLLACFYLIISGLILVAIPKKISNLGANRFLSGLKKDYATD